MSTRNQVAIFYDNDFTNPNNPGQAMAAKICKEYYPMSNIIIPDEYKLKDPSDYIAHFKQTKGLQTLIDIQLWSDAHENQKTKK